MSKSFDISHLIVLLALRWICVALNATHSECDAGEFCLWFWRLWPPQKPWVWRPLLFTLPRVPI